MYDGLSKDDLRIILAHQEWLRMEPHITRYGSERLLPLALKRADEFLDSIEALNTEPESSAKRDDGEGEGTRA